MQTRIIGFVTPWYGEKITGGAEMATRQLVHHLSDSGVPVEVLTTCVKSFRDDWYKNLHKPGLTQEAGIPVRRFRVRKRNAALFDQVNIKLMNQLPITPEEEQIFCEEMVNSPALYRYMKAHSGEYRAFVFIPYMFGTTYYGAQAVPEKSVLIPCLHDESYAYMKCFREVFSKVRGMVFLSKPEQALAERLYSVKGERFPVFGTGIDTDWESNPQRFRDKFGIREPFILYAGRKDTGKRVDVLVRYFAEYKKRHQGDLKLVLIGGGDIDLPDRENIIDLGFVDAQDKYDAYGAASLFCNPSEFESFSIVIMESWFAGTPVLVNGKCAVTRDFVSRTNGGLYYENYPEFEKCVEYILSHEAVAAQMGKNGRGFVLDNFAWDKIVKNYMEYFDRVTPSASQGS